MGAKFKPRQQKLPRNIIVRDMITHSKAAPMKDKRSKRINNPNKRSWNDYEG